MEAGIETDSELGAWPIRYFLFFVWGVVKIHGERFVGKLGSRQAWAVAQAVAWQQKTDGISIFAVSCYSKPPSKARSFAWLYTQAWTGKVIVALRIVKALRSKMDILCYNSKLAGLCHICGNLWQRCMNIGCKPNSLYICEFCTLHQSSVLNISGTRMWL